MGTVPTLDGNPPQPAGGGGSAAPPLQTMAGAPPGNPSGPDQSVQLVTQHLMEAEQALRAAARIKPELAGIVDNFVNTVKPQAGQILFGGGQPPQQAQPGLGTLLASAASRSINTQP
jgi:hypothetical protein